MASSQATTKIDSRQSTDHLDACKRQQRSRDASPALQRQSPGRSDVFRVVFSKAGELLLQTDKPWGGVIALCRPGVKILIHPLHSTKQPHALCTVQGKIADKEAATMYAGQTHMETFNGEILGQMFVQIICLLAVAQLFF